MAGIVAVIPARLNSARFPRKVIYPYRRKPLLFYVWNEVRRSRLIDRVVIATDSVEIQQTAEAFGAEVVRTSSRHATGSDRAAEAIGRIPGRIIVNVQADNFGVKATVLDRAVAAVDADRKVRFATLAYRLTDDAELFNPNVVKVVISPRDRRALWFSRFPIPYVRDVAEDNRTGQHRFFGHIGIYLYRRSGLLEFASWKRTAAEKAESLEQLRVLENGGAMTVYETRMRSVSVDAPEDIEKLDSLYT